MHSHFIYLWMEIDVDRYIIHTDYLRCEFNHWKGNYVNDPFFYKQKKFFSKKNIFKLQVTEVTKELDAYAEAANIAEEVLNGIQTVIAFAGEKTEVNRYKKQMEPAKQSIVRKGLFSGIGDGINRFLFFAFSAIVFWFGFQLVLADFNQEDRVYTPATLIIVR